MILFNQNNVTVELLDLFFDESMDGAVTKIKILNNSDNHIVLTGECLHPPVKTMW